MGNKEIDDQFIQYLIGEQKKSAPFVDANHIDLMEKMLPYIGDHHRAVRDDVICECLAQVTQYLTNDQVDDLVQVYLSDDYLFYDIKNMVSYSVVKRTFTLLQIAFILELDREKNILKSSTIDHIANAMVRYLKEEQVIEGYDETVGWMHSIAHSADVLVLLFSSKDVTSKTKQDLLMNLCHKIQVNHYIYVDGEEERITKAIISGLDSGHLSINMVEDFAMNLAKFIQQSTYRAYFKIHLNVKSLLCALYFALYGDEQYQGLLNTIAQAMKVAKTDKIKKS